jgi:glycosyltransferase involved in cell wall biosynthesis
MHVAFCEARYDSYSGAQQSMEPLVTDSGFQRRTLVTVESGRLLDSVATDRCEQWQTPLGVDVYRLRSLFGPAASRPAQARAGVALLAFCGRATARFRRSDVDVVYCNNLTSLCLYGPPATLAGLPVVWYVRIDSNPYPRLDALGRRLADHRLLISRAVGSRFGHARTDPLPGDCRVLYTGLDLSRFDPSASTGGGQSGRESRLQILHAGTIQPRKGQVELVEAVESVAETLPPFRLAFAGDVPTGHEDYHQRLVERIADSGIRESTALLGYRTDMPALLAQSDMVVLPSESEGLPRIVLEASAAGTPCVAMDSGGASEILTDGESGFLVDVGDTDALADRIQTLARDEPLRESMGRRARRTAEDRFTVGRYVSEFERFLRETVTA